MGAQLSTRESSAGISHCHGQYNIGPDGGHREASRQAEHPLGGGTLVIEDEELRHGTTVSVSMNVNNARKTLLHTEA